MLLTENNLAGLDISELMNRFTKIMAKITLCLGRLFASKRFAQIEGIGRLSLS